MNRKLNTVIIALRRTPLEAVMWMIALISLAFVDPTQDRHITLCPLANLGFDFCPGCGLGRSIAAAFHGDFRMSFELHPLGVFALVVLSSRIYKLLKSNYELVWQKYWR